MIQIRNSVFDRNGEFSIIHEYGHAYHFVAIESPAANDCNIPHAPGVENNARCAFVEGFADFFSGIVSGSRQVTGDWIDNTFERDPYTTRGYYDEGRVAAFLYDVIDTGSELDSGSNTADGDDDHIALSGAWLANLIQSCSLPGVTRLVAIDQLVYCMEGDVSAYADFGSSNNWGSFSSVSPSVATPPGWSKAVIRQLWQFDRYSLGSLP